MTLTLSGVIIGLILLVAIPIGLIGVRLQRNETGRIHQEQVNRAAADVAQILQGLQTKQLQISLNEVEPTNINFVIPQIITVRDLTIRRVAAQVQEVVDNQNQLDTLFALNDNILGVQQFSLAGQPSRQVWRNPALPFDPVQPSPDTLALVQEGISTQDDFFFDVNHVPIMVVATPIYQQNTAESLVIVWVSLPIIWTYLTDLKLGEAGYFYIADQDNRLVRGPSQVLEPASRAPANIEPEIVDWQINQQAYAGLGGQPVYGKSAPIDGSPWIIVGEIPVFQANAALRSLLIILVAILLFGISLAIWVARLFSRWLLQPIHTLHESATEISQGNLTHRITLNRDDELGFLATTFNQMVARLEQTINELRAVSLNLLTAQETERRRIAQELHDELGQSLTALRFGLAMGIKADPDNKAMAVAHQQAADIQAQARTLSHELRPAMLDELGLMPTLEWFVDRVEQRANLAITLETQLNEADLSSVLKTTLYRLVVEALTNISNHAQAAVVEISLIVAKPDLILTICDDGGGFDTTTLDQIPSLGIRGMRERVNLLRGQFLIESKIGAGTKLTITLPLE